MSLRVIVKARNTLLLRVVKVKVLSKILGK
jgi:hypothetical protein